MPAFSQIAHPLTAINGAHDPRDSLIPETDAMARILVLSASYHGQTAKIASRVKEVLSRMGHVVTLRSAIEPDAAADLGAHDAVVIGAAIHRGNHHKAVAALVRKHIALLRSRPNAFFSVSLSAAGDARQQGIARRMLEKFLTATGWHPDETATFAGALQYRQYHLPLRLMMRFIATFAGRDTDSSRDYEYTDWAEVERFATRFGARIPAAKAA